MPKLTRPLWLFAALLALCLFFFLVQKFLQPGQIQRPAIISPIPEDETAAKKARFINALVPAIHTSNEQILSDRAQLEAMIADHATGNLTSRQREWLIEKGAQYELPDTSAPTQQWLATLMRRMDVIPVGLALAQGAMESAWGTSRFATEANNYFGIWCFSPGCGIVPAKRPAGARHEVARFDSLDTGVAYYMNNLNTHPSYKSMRILREQQRRKQQTPSGLVMAEGLLHYSQIGERYIHTIQAMIRSNQFSQYGNTYTPSTER